MSEIRRIGFAYNPTQEATVELSARASGWCRVRGIGEWQAPSGDFERLCQELPTSDALVVLGGDGTFLRAARAVAEVDVPLLGINLGKVGFLSKAEAGELESVLEKIAAGAYSLDSRMVIEGRILRGGGLGAQERHIALNDIVTGNALDIKPLSPEGLMASAMIPAQRDQLMKILDAYAGLMTAELAADRMAKVKAAGIEKIGFAWAGSIERGQKHYYRVQGPTFLIEFDNSQNDGNHVHSIWRDFNGDFGRDILREHLKTATH